MKLIDIKLIAFTFITLIATIPTTLAFDLSSYAQNSKLASGKWVKIAISEDGVYEITNDELIQFGFSDPSKVKLFGYGGRMLPENLNETLFVDDFDQVPILRTSDKICFYGRSATPLDLVGASSNVPRYTPNINAYSSKGFYFLTDDSSYPELLVEIITKPNTGVYEKTTSFDYAYHEKEEISISTTGKQFLGEDLTAEKKLTLKINMPNLVNGEKYLVNTALAMSATEIGYITTSINGETVTYAKNSNIIRPPDNVYVKYNYNSPYAYFTPSKYSDNVDVTVGIDCNGAIKTLKNDYIVLTYTHHNMLLNGINQTRMGFLNLNLYNKIKIADSDANTVIWNIDKPKAPIQYMLESQNGDNNTIISSCTPTMAALWAQFITFNPTRELMKVQFVENIANQNLHAMPVPDMIIITTHDFMPQAQTIANHHIEADGMDVAVIDHRIIFNEFSSGTPDATAYRRFAKMLWDKDPVKFKYLLLFGGGSYDNRKLIGNKGDNLLLTYQSAASNVESTSYTTDDYFGLLDDNSGNNIPADKIKISIGRMPVASITEADNAVSKLLDYINNGKYDNWRNNILIIADQGDNDLHMFQAEGLEQMIKETSAKNMQINKIYAEAFPLSGKLAETARKKMTEFLTQGQFLATYIGHGGPQFLTKEIQLWRKEDVKNTTTSNIPIFSLATCDVARFDSDQRGIAEDMFHKLHGGAIACLASTRSVNSANNDMLNRYFIKGLFTKNTDGTYPTIGEAYKNAKTSFIDTDANKLNFLLLGDPAMKLHYPSPSVIITSVNGLPAESASINPMTEVTVTGIIVNNQGIKNTTFNGTITATLYDKAIYYKDFKSGETPNSTIYHSYFQNDILNQAIGTVINGDFSMKITTPKECLASNQKVTLRLFAHNAENNEIVNGCEQNITMARYDESAAIIDTQAPTVTEMYMNTPTFCDGDAVDTSGKLYIYFSDNVGINIKSIALGESMKLSLDNKTSFPEVTNYYTASADGKGGYVSMPLKDMQYGIHTAQFSVSDLAGNKTTHAISFYVQPADVACSLDVEESPARERATFNFEHQYISSSPEVTISVTNDSGQLIWQKTTTSFPCEWNLTDTSGKRISEGTYNFSGIISAGNQRGHTTNKKIIVVKQ